MDGDATRAWAQIARVLPEGAATRVEAAPVFPGAPALRVAARMAMDTGEQARPWLEAHDRWLAATGALLGRSEGAALWGEYHRQVGDREQAQVHAEHALVHA